MTFYVSMFVTLRQSNLCIYYFNVYSITTMLKIIYIILSYYLAKPIEQKCRLFLLLFDFLKRFSVRSKQNL